LGITRILEPAGTTKLELARYSPTIEGRIAVMDERPAGAADCFTEDAVYLDPPPICKSTKAGERCSIHPSRGKSSLDRVRFDSGCPGRTSCRATTAPFTKCTRRSVVPS
jgi:hypothetical protein